MNNIKPNLVFGCGGDRDKSKRITMGKIANLYANRVYITNDNRAKIKNNINQKFGSQIIEVKSYKKY